MKLRVDDGDRFALLAIRIFGNYLSVEDFVDGNNILRYKRLSDNIFTACNTAYLRRNSVLTEDISMFIMYSFDCGLLEIWDKQVK